MGLRFRKSLTLAPGLRLNFSGSGASLSLGPRGMSMTVGSRGAFANVGIPGTGLAFRERIGGNSRAATQTLSPTTASTTATTFTGKAVITEEGEIRFLDENGNPYPEQWLDAIMRQNADSLRAGLQQQCDNLNTNLQSLSVIHLATTAPTKGRGFVPQLFDVDHPVSPRLEVPGFFARILRYPAQKIAARNSARELAYAEALGIWKSLSESHRASELQRKDLHDKVGNGDRVSMENALERTLTSVDWPRETKISFDLSSDGEAVNIDVDLPEIADMPKKTASLPARGFKLTMRDLSTTTVQKSYMAHVHGVGFRIIGETFAVLPTVREIVLSAYSQRVNPATGVVRDEYLYSVKVSKDDWGTINFSNLSEVNLVDALAKFQLRRNMTKTGVFKAVEPWTGFKCIVSEQKCRPEKHAVGATRGEFPI